MPMFPTIGEGRHYPPGEGRHYPPGEGRHYPPATRDGSRRMTCQIFNRFLCPFLLLVLERRDCAACAEAGGGRGQRRGWRGGTAPLPLARV